MAAVYHRCPACDRRKAMDSAGPYDWPDFRCRCCTMCRAYSIDETVVLGGSENVDPLKDPTAAKVLAAALRESAIDDQAQSVRLLARARETGEIAAMLESKAAGMVA